MSVGTPLARLDGPAKVTGRARFAADHRVDGMLYGTFVTASAPAGRVRAIDADAARAVPDVVAVLTHEDMPRYGEATAVISAGAHLPMQDDRIRHDGQPVAIVLAETLEAAEHAASLVRVDIEAAPFTPYPDGDDAGAIEPPASSYTWFPTTVVKGDVDAAIAAAPVVHEGVYVQPARHHNPMEPSATLADWRDGMLTLVDAVQHVYGVQWVLCGVFGLEPEQVRVRSPHTGGGFGCKGFVWPHQVLTAAASIVLERPVRIALTRAQMYGMVGYQSQLVQAITLATDDSGRLAALEHDAVNVTAVFDDWVEYATEGTRSTYATPTMRLTQRVQRANVDFPTAMRPPTEGCGIFPLEAAMNELAHTLDVDPLELRLRNYAEVDPDSGKPWSSKELRACYEQGARAFGWRAAPRRDGRWIVGQGMATCLHGGTPQAGSQARVRLRADGSAVAECGFQDIGTGTSTVVSQLVAEVLGVEPARVECRMGDTRLPEAAPTYGSTTTMSVGAAVVRAAADVLAQLGVRDHASPEQVAAALRASGRAEIVGEGSFAPATDSPYVMRTFGAIFVEVGVDPQLGLLRLRRAVGRYSVGRIMNPRTARAQMTGGIIWGWGKAAMEQSHHEPRLGRWLSKNLAGVAIPVNADIPADIDVGFVTEVDHASPIGGKGIGEVGATGVEAAVIDAVFHATGRRIRELPITPPKLI
ncbi:Aldehyde oxidoreductase molybdenum-binding subunit PaoC [Baekduia alba]|uniref:xanthine dehydrogenase family protein molybdopterin-binding subunit n=1 Tax=Baekduia alba TaxID=2997333 RepID=UPI00234239A8|nr:xanthine dehydrogenase family protein molybdopterin-binding subunit [Baekduia alba]WCB96862.1 Aldehyde oxidoreductase molybdenum-binding subunit PaoC [Baekduia alba]